VNQPQTAPATDTTVLAFDFGTRRIGVAVGNTITRAAQPLTTIDEPRVDMRFAAIGALIDAWTPGLLVVGVPVHADGTAHAMTARAQRFARQLAGRYGKPVAEVDERYTTEMARQLVAARPARARPRAGDATRDSVAAQLILQGYFDECRAA
jgi:putative holliday junction resolvase